MELIKAIIALIVVFIALFIWPPLAFIALIALTIFEIIKLAVYIMDRPRSIRQVLYVIVIHGIPALACIALVIWACT